MKDGKHDFRDHLFRVVIGILSSIPFLLVVMLILVIIWFKLHGNSPSEQTDFRTIRTISLDFLLAAIWSGFMGMAVIQFWKTIFIPRARFHYLMLRSIFGEAYYDLIRLAAPGFARTKLPSKVESIFLRRNLNDRYLFLDSPIQILMSQIREAAEHALLNPRGHLQLLEVFLGNRQSEGEIRELLKKIEQGKPSSEARYILDKNLQFLHIQLHNKWQFRVRLFAAMVSGFLGICSGIISNASTNMTIGVGIASLILGGVLSWTLRDLTAVVEQKRL